MIAATEEDWSVCQRHRVGARLTSLARLASAAGDPAE